MERMTYRELLVELQKMTDDQLDCDVTVEDVENQECYAATISYTNDQHDSLDDDHPILCF